VGHERRHAIVLAFQPVVLDRHVLALDGAGFVEALAERSAKVRRDLWRSGTHEADHRHRRLLRVRRKRPRCRRAAEQRDELASFHSITSSARLSTEAGRSRPSALAVFRLMTNSYFVGVGTGKSAGFSPLRMRST